MPITTAPFATLLIAVLGLVGVLDTLLIAISTPFADRLGGAIDLGRILGWLFTPIAALIGIEYGDLQEAGRLLGAVTVDDLIDHMLPADWRDSGNGS